MQRFALEDLGDGDPDDVGAGADAVAATNGENVSEEPISSQLPVSQNATETESATEVDPFQRQLCHFCGLYLVSTIRVSLWTPVGNRPKMSMTPP